MRKSLLFLLFPVLALSASRGATVKVAVFSTDGDHATEDLCIAAISQNPGIQLVDRRNLNQLLGEQVVTAALASSVRTSHLSKLSGIDLILSIRQEKEGKHNLNLEILDCATGRVLSHGTATDKSLPVEMQRLLKQAEASASPHAKTVKVAVEDFSENTTGINYKLPEEIREALVDIGFNVLDRAVIDHAAAEHELEKSGFASGNLATLLGADYLIRGKIESQTLNIQILDAHKGRIEKSASFPIVSAVKEVANLFQERFKDIKPSPESILEPRVQIEALIPLYQGVKYFRDGDIPSALVSFWRAENLDDKFVEAIEWEARCYEAMNLPVFAASIRRYEHECLVGSGVSVPSKNIPSDGITFLGIQSLDQDRLLEAKAVDTLAAMAPGQIVLPDELASYRNEYDAIVGGSDKAWLTAPSFLTRWSLRASPSPNDPSKWEWTLFDTVSGAIVGTSITENKLPDKWGQALGKLLQETAHAAPISVNATTPNVYQSKQNTSSSAHNLGKNDSADLELLEMLATEPQNPALRGKSFKREGNPEGPFLNYALKEQIRLSLPETDPYRGWLELDKIASFLKYDPSGMLYSGEKLDPIEALNKFVESHPNDAPGAFARYMLVIDTVVAMEPQERIEACHRSVAALRRAFIGTDIITNKDSLLDAAKNLEILSRIAAGDMEGITYLPGSPYPGYVRPELLPGGAIKASFGGHWQLSGWEIFKLPRESWQQEAEAAIRIIGRGNDRNRIPPSWLKETPDSVVLLGFCIEFLYQVELGTELPLSGPINMKEERENYRGMVDFIIPRLLQRTVQVSTPQELMQMAVWSSYTVRRLSFYSYFSSVSDEELLKIQQSLKKSIVEAAKRIGENPERYTDDGWTNIPRRFSTDHWNVWWRPITWPGLQDQHLNRPLESYENMTQREMAAAQRSFADSPVQSRDWWSFLHSLSAVNSATQADFALRHLGKMNELYHPSDLTLAPMLGEREAAFLFNYGSTLFYGRDYQEAEPWFRLVASIPDGVLIRTRDAQEIRENARFYRAKCLEREGRLNESLSLALGAVTSASAESPPMRYITHVWPSGAGLRFDYDGFLNTVGMRLVRDIRLLASSNELPDRMRVFQIPIQGKNDDKAIFFLRMPPASTVSGRGKIPLLVLNPSFNHGGAEYILNSNAWARFADEYGVCLLVPEFEFANERSGSLEYEMAAFWSGKTLLEAVEWVGEHYPVSTHRFMIHGYGGGGIFASNFVRWAPERCLAASLNSFGDSSSRFDGCPDLKPFSALRSVPLIITCGDRDDARFSVIFNRQIITESYAAAAKAAGVDVEWKTLPDTGHVPTREMEKTVQDFFVRKAHLTKRTP
jgi:hypothetical protein